MTEKGLQKKAPRAAREPCFGPLFLILATLGAHMAPGRPKLRFFMILGPIFMELIPKAFQNDAKSNRKGAGMHMRNTPQGN